MNLHISTCPSKPEISPRDNSILMSLPMIGILPDRLAEKLTRTFVFMRREMKDSSSS